MVAQRPLPQITLVLLYAAAAQKVAVMDALRLATSSISLRAPNSKAEQDLRPDALTVVARMPTMVAAYWRMLNGREPVPPRSDLGHAANFLYMLSGDVPDKERARGLETYFNAVVDHGMNASTFTARVIISTQSDLISAISGAIGALKGPLHGGAPGPALDMVFEIGEPSRAESYLRAKLERDERLMGFGHRIYKVRDPRADVLSAAAERFFHASGDMALYDLARHVEKTAVRLLIEYKPGRRLDTNVEFYTALLLHGLDLPPDLFTPAFAISRVVGWAAHCFEQQALNRIIRPQSVYTGAKNGAWVPVEQRS